MTITHQRRFRQRQHRRGPIDGDVGPPDDPQGSRIGLLSNGSTSASLARSATRWISRSPASPHRPIPTVGRAIAPARADRENWFRLDTGYDPKADGGTLTIRHTAESPILLARLFRALFDGAAPRPDRLGRRMRGRRLSLASAPASTGSRSTASNSAAARRRSGSTRASIRARAWPNGGWKARSKS